MLNGIRRFFGGREPLFAVYEGGWTAGGEWFQDEPSCETTIASLIEGSRGDAFTEEVVEDIVPALRGLRVDQEYVYNGGAGGLTKYRRIR